ncbi:MAG: GDP-mannose 4,6-dehydratase [Candidatus Hadarchaeales archaeon]
MRVLITGITGFIGSHLADFLTERGCEVWGTHFRNSFDNVNHLKERLELRKCDVRNKEEVKKVLEESGPEIIFHLAAQSRPDLSWKDPWTTMEVNVLGTVNLFESVRELGLDPKILVACSSAEYGFISEGEGPIREDHPLNPVSPYAVSKVAQDLMAYQYFKNYGLRTFRVRIFGTTGPRKVGDACADFASQIVLAEKKGRGTIKVGNLEPRRDLTDVRDMVRALWSVVERGREGEVYNACSGKAYRIGEVLERMLELARVKVKVELDREKLRPSDEPLILGDNGKIRSECGWKPEISLEKTLKDILDYWRKKE